MVRLAREPGAFQSCCFDGESKAFSVIIWLNEAKNGKSEK